VVLLAPFSVSGVVSSRVSKADSLSIASRSWLSYKREVSGCFGDIGQVLKENFDWLSFTPLVAFSGPSTLPPLPPFANLVEGHGTTTKSRRPQPMRQASENDLYYVEYFGRKV
jgi:hypothetical protein